MKSQLFAKDSDTGKDLRQEKGTTVNEMVGWNHWFNGHDFEQTGKILKDRETWYTAVQWVTELDMTEWLKNNNIQV